MWHATIGRGAWTALIAGFGLVLTAVAADANDEGYVERTCLGQGIDEECMVWPPSGTVDRPHTDGPSEKRGADRRSGETDHRWCLPRSGRR